MTEINKPKSKGSPQPAGRKNFGTELPWFTRRVTPANRNSDFIRISFGFALLFGLLLMSARARAAFVYETPSEFITSGDFDGDGRTDALVLDKLTGSARIGYQSPAGALVWSSPFASGIENVTGLGIGRFVATNHDAIAATAPDFNRIALLDVPIPGSNSPPTIILPGLATATNGLIAAWDFLNLPATTISTATPATIAATVGTGTVDVSAFGLGSPQGTNPERTSFTGSTLNTFPGSVDGNPGTALALANNSANGKAVVFSFSMAGYHDLVVSFATRGTSTGFNSGVWAWSTDGINYVTLAGVNTATTSTTFATATANFTAATGLNNAATVYLRYTLSGATAVAGNNRIDNIQLNATPVAAGGIGPQGLAGLASPFGTNASFDRLLCASSQNPDPAARLNLLGLTAGTVVAAPEYAETAPLDRVNPLPIASNLTFAVGLVRGETNDALHVWQFTNSPGILLALSNLPPGSDYTFGHFNDEPYPRLLFYVPGQSNIVVQSLTNDGSGFTFGAATLNTFTSTVQRVFYVAEPTNGLVLVQLGSGVVSGLRLSPGSDGQLSVDAGFAVGPTGNEITGVVPLGIGKFALLSSSSNSVASTFAQVFTQSGGNYTQTSSSTLPATTTTATRGNVWLFQIEPFASSASLLIGSLSAPAWSSTISGLPGTLSVRVESDGGTTTGLNNPATNNFGPPPAGTVYVLPNQYREDISFFGYGPARAPEPSVITIAPPPGSYGGPIQVSFSKQNATDTVSYRSSSSAPWQNYVAPFALTNDATIQYYGATLSGARGRTQLASYSLGNIAVPPEPLVTVPGSDTNPPPTVNPNVPQISTHGTVFYSRHTALAELESFQGPSPYLSFVDSPFNATGFKYFYLEDFEDNSLNAPGATPSAGWVVASNAGGADSVDPGGHSYYSGGTQTNLTIVFNAAALGGKLPTHVGIVWTDVGNVTSGTFGVGTVRFTARDANGVSLGTNVGGNLGNGFPAPSQGEDRFFGVVNPGGISSISITMTNSADWEVDHLQYGYLDSAGFNDSIWAINLDGNGEMFITEGARPRVSPDGQWLAFLREGGAVTTHGNLWLRKLSTGVETRFFTNTDAILGFDWNGTNELVFDNNCVLLRQPLGGSATQLSLALTPQCLNGAPVVNPVDGRLAFQNLNPNAPGVYVTPPNWASRTKVPEPGTLRLRWPAWSRDGARLAMADRISSVFINTGVNLWTAAADGSNLQQITALTEPTGGFPHGAVWTTDGHALVGAGRIGGTNGLWVINLAADGSACHCPPRLLPTSAGSEIDFVGSVLSAARGTSDSYLNLGLFIRLDPSVLVVYWSTNYDGFTLEAATELPAGLSWASVTGPYFRAGQYFEYREARTAMAARKFFRLHSPGVLVLTPPEPEMDFHLEPNAAVLNWPVNYVGYTIEATTNLAPPILWTPLEGMYLKTNGVFEYRRALPGPPQEFYRLRGP